MSTIHDRPVVVHDDDNSGGRREQLPPQDLTAERSVLGAMLLSKDAIADVVEVMRPEYFYRPAHQSIYHAILELYGRGEPADFITVADELGKSGKLDQVGGPAYVTGLTRDLPSAVNATYYAEIVRQRALLRRLIEASTRILQAAYDGAGEADDIVNRAQAEIFEISAGKRGEDYAPLKDILEGAIAEIEAIANHDGDMVGVPTGLRDLDTLTQGLHPGQLIILAARPAIGKALALDTEIATPSGWTTMGEITPGDQLFAPDGSVTRVVAATEVMADRPCYRVHFSDGSAIVADEEHLWLTESRAERRACQDAGLPRQRRTTLSNEQVQQWTALRAQLHESLAMSAPEPADLAGLRPSSSALRRALLDVGASGSRRERRRTRTWGSSPSDASRSLARVGGPTIGEAALLGDVLRADDVAMLLGTSTKTAKRRLRRYRTPCTTTTDGLGTTRRPPEVYPARDVLAALAENGARLLNDQGGSANASVRTTGEIAATLMAGDHYNHSVPIASPLDLPTAVLPISPYVLGTWLGDGHAAAARVTSGDDETWDLLETEGLVVRHVGGAPLTRSLTYGTPNPVTGARSLLADLRSLRVLGAKHIPAIYLRASQSQRKALLAGLLDTDGTVTSTGSPQFTTTSARLAEDVFDLIVGLGYRCSVARRVVAGRSMESSVAYTLNFTSDEPLFRLRRKRDLHRSRRIGVRTTAALQRRYVIKVERIASVPVRCIQVDREDGMFLAGRSMIPTHNSTLGLDIARSASVKNGLAAVIFSLEMSRTEIMMRLLSAEGSIQLHNIRAGRMGAGDWQKVAQRQDALRDAPLFIDDSPNMTMTEIRAKCRRLKQQHDLRLVVVDYMQLMTSGKKVESRQQEVSEFSRALKLLAKELEVPVIAISQLNRGPEQRTDKKPMLADLRESGSLEQDADVVVLIHREDFYDKENRPGEADLIVAKHRNGPTDTVAVSFQGHYSRFVDLAG